MPPPPPPAAEPLPPAPVLWGQHSWARPHPAPAAVAPAAAPRGSPWLVALTLGLAAAVLALVFVGVAVVDAPEEYRTSDSGRRTGQLPPPSDPRTASPFTTNPGAPPSTASLPRALWTVDTTAAQTKVTNAEARYEITVPHTWVSEARPDGDKWNVPVRLVPPDPDLVMIGYSFAVQWGPSRGCTLEGCAAQVLAAVTAANPDVLTTMHPDSAGGRDAIRLESTRPEERMVIWVVVKGERYWATLFGGPVDGFDDVLAVIRPIVTSMSFGR